MKEKIAQGIMKRRGIISHYHDANIMTDRV